MTTFTHADLLALARGEVLPPDVFQAIVAEPAAIQALNRLLRLHSLFDAADETLKPVTPDVTVVELSRYLEGSPLAPERARAVAAFLAHEWPDAQPLIAAQASLEHGRMAAIQVPCFRSRGDHFSAPLALEPEDPRGPLPRGDPPVAVSDLDTSHLQPLLARFREGDRDAADELVRRAASRLELMAHQQLRRFPVVRAQEQTADIVQEAVSSLLKALRQEQPGTTKEFYDLAAQHIRWRLLDLARHYRLVGPVLPLDALPGGSEAVPDAADRDLDRWSALHEAVEQLPDVLRQVFDLRFYHGRKWQDVAEEIHLSVPAARLRWLEAQAHLVERLGGDPPEL
jgi:RNA polymerase sigma-70 factor (ECF subfamily)